MVERWHRHHKPCVGHRFSIGLQHETELIGAAIIGRPVSREVDWHTVCEVTRLVTNGHPNACSKLYGAAARIAKEMGFQSIQTYILDSEPAISLKAAGWHFSHYTQGGSWNCNARSKRREDQPLTPKQLWKKDFR